MALRAVSAFPHTPLFSTAALPRSPLPSRLHSWLPFTNPVTLPWLPYTSFNPSCRPFSTVRRFAKRRSVGPTLYRAFSASHYCHHTFCSVLSSSSIHTMATPWTYFLHLSLSSVILIDSSTASPVHILLSIQAVRGLRRLRAPGIVPCIISLSRQLPCVLLVWP